MLLKDKLKKYRKEHGLTQIDFAKKIGISRGYLSDLEIGKVNGNMKILKALSAATGLPFDYWGDIELENGYSNLQALDLFLDTLIENGKVDLHTGEIDPKAMNGVMRILKAEILLKASKIKERD